MSSEPILVIKDTDSTIGIRARVGEDFSEHEIQLSIMLAYYWDNNLPVIEELVNLFETVIKRTINEVLPHENLLLKYNLLTDAEDIKESTRFEIQMMEVKADDVPLRLDGKILALKGLSSQEDFSKESNEEEESPKFMNLIEKNIPTEKKLTFKEFARQQRLKDN